MTKSTVFREPHLGHGGLTTGLSGLGSKGKIREETPPITKTKSRKPTISILFMLDALSPESDLFHAVVTPTAFLNKSSAYRTPLSIHGSYTYFV